MVMMIIKIRMMMMARRGIVDVPMH